MTKRSASRDDNSDDQALPRKKRSRTATRNAQNKAREENTEPENGSPTPRVSNTPRLHSLPESQPRVELTPLSSSTPEGKEIKTETPY